MNKFTLTFLLLAALFLSNYSKAESLLTSSQERVHFAEHFVASGLIYTGVYGAMHDGLGAPKWTSFAFGALTSGVIGLAYKGTEGFPSDTGRKMIYNAAGIGTAAFLCWKFNF